MSELEAALAAVWMKYKPQRDAELDATKVAREASVELMELNQRRLSAGLGTVIEAAMASGFAQQMTGQQLYAYPSPRTWRDEMDAELLLAVKRWLQ